MAAATLIFLSGPPPSALGHADLLLQIEELSGQIAQDPQNPELYLRRGQLRREHLEFEASYADFEKASELVPQLAKIDVMRGRLFLDWGWPLSAKACLDRFLSRQPKQVDALILRARALIRLGQPLAAVEDFDLALQMSPEPSPDLFVERAQVLMSAGPEQVAQAVRGLDEGLRRLGPLVTLQLFAIDAEMKLKNYDGALARVDAIVARSPRKETWLSRRAEILVQAGRPREARRAYEDALAALQSLPPTRRNVPAMQELARRIQREIDGLGPAIDAGIDGISLPVKP